MKSRYKQVLSAGLVVVAAAAASAVAIHPWVARAQNANDAERKILERMEKDGCAVLDSGVKVCRADYTEDGHAVEAITFVPAGDGPFPGALLIPGYERTARDLMPLGVRLAGAGFAGIAVSQPGFGKSQGPPDFVGPKTLAVLTVAYRKLQKEHYVDPNRMGIYGYSRGGMAASLLAVRLDDVKAAVFGAGVYDFQRAYNDSVPGIRANMMAETGMTREAIRERSSIFMMENLKCPVLILHGEKDKNVSVVQAKMLRDRLTQLHKDFEIKLFPDKEHSIGPPAGDMTLDFFQRRLGAKSSQN